VKEKGSKDIIYDSWTEKKEKGSKDIMIICEKEKGS
jgi:hypothetical protein